MNISTLTAAPTAATPVPNYPDYTDSTIEKSLCTTVYHSIQSSILYGVQGCSNALRAFRFCEH